MLCKQGEKSNAWECLFCIDNKSKLFRFKHNVFLSRCTFDPRRYWLCLFYPTSKTVQNFVLGSLLLVDERWAWCTWCNRGHTSGCPLPNPAPILPPASAQCIQFLIWSQVLTPKLHLANVQTPSLFYFPPLFLSSSHYFWALSVHKWLWKRRYTGHRCPSCPCTSQPCAI